MNSTVDNINLPVLPKTVQDLLEVKDATNFNLKRKRKNRNYKSPQKYKHLDGAYIFEKSSLALEKMMKKHNNERNRKVAVEGSLLLHESYFLQYNSLLFNCERQYLKLVDLLL